MNSRNLIQQLRERGLVAQVTDEKGLETRLEKAPIVLYCGFDPTASSLHLGHLIPLLCLRRFQMAGHKPIALVGGATGMIGDPSFREKERNLNGVEVVHQWGDQICQQIAKFLDFNCGSNSAITLNNYSWFMGMNMLTFLRDIGKNFSVNKMINKEAVKQRLNRDQSGLSFTEFSYNVLQSFDFSELYQKHHVELQIGGSDQWGNITSGINLTHRIHHKVVFGLTMPLIIKTDGTKFGKTEDNTLWLSADKTTPYKFYQFWLNTSDADVYRFLKFFTFLSLEEIDYLERKDKTNHKVRNAQYVLAEKVTSIVHGKESVTAAKRISKSLFSGTLNGMIEADFDQLAQDGIPTIKLSENTDLKQALIKAKLAPSRGQARTMIAANAVSINGNKQSNEKYTFSNLDRCFGRYTLLRRGKKHYCLVDWK